MLKDKKFIFLGSSVTFGALSGEYSFVECLRDEDGITVLSKEAVSGTTLVTSEPDNYIERMLTIDKNLKADMFICQLSTNDGTRDKPLGVISNGTALEDFDTETITGALEYVIKYASDTWNCPVVFYTGSWFECDLYNQMVDRLYELSKKWDIEIIDLYNDKELNSIDKSIYDSYMADPIHPNRDGYVKWWTPFMRDRIIEIFSL